MTGIGQCDLALAAAFQQRLQAGEGGLTNSATALFLRVRFDGQSHAGITVHATADQSFQDCEFVNGKIGFTHGHDRTRGVYLGERGLAGGVALNCVGNGKILKDGCFDDIKVWNAEPAKR